MRNRIIYITVTFIVMLLLILNIKIFKSSADIMYFDPEGGQTGLLSFNSNSNEMALSFPMAGKLKVYSPLTFLVQYEVDLPVRPFANSFSCNSNKLFCGISVPGNDYGVEEGKVAIIDTSSHIINGFIELDKIPQGIIPCSDNVHLFTYGGVHNHQEGKVYKINANSMQIEAEAITGDSPTGFALNDDETKLYVADGQLYGTSVYDPVAETSFIESPYYFKIWVYDSLDLSKIAEIETDIYTVDLIKGPSDMLIAAHGYPGIMPGDENDSSLTLINTQDDSIEREIRFANYGFGALAYNTQNGLLYSSIQIKTQDDWTGSSSVAVVNLNNDSMSLIPMGQEKIGYLALSPDGTRLYAKNESTNRIYYMDL
jgi:DNA-binding beta-propeller fold protein YncE